MTRQIKFNPFHCDGHLNIYKILKEADKKTNKHWVLTVSLVTFNPHSITLHMRKWGLKYLNKSSMTKIINASIEVQLHGFFTSL